MLLLFLINIVVIVDALISCYYLGKFSSTGLVHGLSLVQRDIFDLTCYRKFVRYISAAVTQRTEDQLYVLLLPSSITFRYIIVVVIIIIINIGYIAAGLPP